MAETVFSDVGDAEQAILAVVPERADDLARLRLLADAARPPVVTVIGKYNHGKSRLLNELIGATVFSVADRRETVVLAEHDQTDVRWLDAPGLDADIAEVDDGHARLAAWQHADVRLFVHAAREGELDAAELALLQVLHDDEMHTRRQTLFVLTQVDQVAEAAQLDQVISAIATQRDARAPAAALHPVSASRHRQGVESGKRMLIERSGIPALQAALRGALARVPDARTHETALRFDGIDAEMKRLRAEQTVRLQTLQATRQRQRLAFDEGLAALLEKAQVDLISVLEVVGTDQALVPDSFQNMFKLTAGKVERSRIQVAYSKVCISINAHLIRHGVVGLPVSQRTSVTSLDTVMVAVLGVSVKYRDDLRRMFFEQEGRAALTRDFARYFELSNDRQTLEREIAHAVAELRASALAFQALAVLKSVR